jgi:hypothetical protein
MCRRAHHHPSMVIGGFSIRRSMLFSHIRVGFLRTLADENRISGGHADIL